MLLDSNIIIYAVRSDQSALRQFIRENAPVVSLVSYVETLGYHRLRTEEKQLLEEFFAASEILPVTKDIANRAISLRQRRKMSLGDALIAGTALVYKRSLVTHNYDDFNWIPELTLIDPIDN